MIEIAPAGKDGHPDWSREICGTAGPSVVADRVNATFIAAARTGWPHAIDRAIAAEARVAERGSRLDKAERLLGEAESFILYFDNVVYLNERAKGTSRPTDAEVVADLKRRLKQYKDTVGEDVLRKRVDAYLDLLQAKEAGK